MTRRLTRVTAGLVLAATAAACGQTSPSALPSTAPSAAPSVLPSAAASAASPSAVSPASPSVASPTPAATVPTAARPTEEDEGLLAVLPEDVSGTPVQLEGRAFTDAASDPAFAASIEAAAFFVAPGESDIVSGLVAKPRDGVYSEAWLIDWRETYEAGAVPRRAVSPGQPRRRSAAGPSPSRPVRVACGCTRRGCRSNGSWSRFSPWATTAGASR